MKEFLKHSGDMYVSDRYPVIKIGNYNLHEQISSLLTKVKVVGESINKSLVFLENNEEEVISSINTVFDSLETKTQILIDSIQYASKLKYSTSNSPSDISVMSISTAKYHNCVYSISHGGIILSNAVSTGFKLKEG